MRALARRSVEVIREGQSETGAYVACPTFAPYRFCWLRDGSFIADAMSRVGEVESAEAFFAWCARVVVARRERIEAGDLLDARYTLDGEDDVSEWPLRQHDGYGLWLWALRKHLDRHDRRDAPFREGIELTKTYLARVAWTASVDWWEEREGLHGATEACVIAGLRAWTVPERAHIVVLEDRLDASQLVLVPLGLARRSNVVKRVETELLSPGGGVHRHAEDVYYGGGEWILLTALLGWARALSGDELGARRCLEWVRAHATNDGELPEQSQDNLLHPESWQPWVDKWGPPPSPLLWSHAMFLTLAHELGEV